MVKVFRFPKIHKIDDRTYFLIKDKKVFFDEKLLKTEEGKKKLMKMIREAKLVKKARPKKDPRRETKETFAKFFKKKGKKVGKLRLKPPRIEKVKKDEKKEDIDIVKRRTELIKNLNDERKTYSNSLKSIGDEKGRDLLENLINETERDIGLASGMDKFEDYRSLMQNMFNRLQKYISYENEQIDKAKGKEVDKVLGRVVKLKGLLPEGVDLLVKREDIKEEIKLRDEIVDLSSELEKQGVIVDKNIRERLKEHDVVDLNILKQDLRDHLDDIREAEHREDTAQKLSKLIEQEKGIDNDLDLIRDELVNLEEELSSELIDDDDYMREKDRINDQIVRLRGEREEIHQEMEMLERTGSGASSQKGKGMTNLEIDKIMKVYPEFLGTISHDQMQSEVLPQVKPKSRGCFIINTDPADEPGEHWQCCFFDARPGGDSEIDFFDSYGDEPSDSIMKGVKGVADKLDAKTYLKFKENMIRYQGDSDNCGAFCIKFLIDRLNGKSFKHASGYNDSVKGEKEIERFKEQQGFGYVSSGLQDGEGFIGNIRRFLGLTGASKSVKSFLKSFGDDTIKAIKVYRDPINSAISNTLNVLTLGEVKKKIKKKGYDSLYHLYAVMQLQDSTRGSISYWRVEKTPRIEVKRYTSFPTGRDSVEVPRVGGTVIEAWKRAESKQGSRDFYSYNHQDNNCQVFIKTLLQSNGWWNDSLEKFVMQDAQELMEKHNLLNRFAESTTELAELAETAKEKIEEGIKGVKEKVQSVLRVGEEEEIDD